MEGCLCSGLPVAQKQHTRLLSICRNSNLVCLAWTCTKTDFKCYFSFAAAIALVLLQAMPGYGMLIVVNESVHLGKLCRAKLTEHNCSVLPSPSPLLILLSFAFKSNTTESAPSDPGAFFSIQDSSQLLLFFHPHSPVILGWRIAKLQSLQASLAQGKDTGGYSVMGEFTY